VRRASVALLVLGLAPAAAAQQESGGLMLSASGGYFGINSSDTARAVFDKPGGSTYGGELGYVLGEHLYFTLGARSFNRTGQRVFVAEPGGEVFKLGFPLELRMVPAQATVGWRLGRKRLFGIPLTPYLGIGGGVTSYREESTVAGEVRKYSVSKPSGHGLLGLELGSGHWRFGVEASYSSVPNAIGDSPDGVSKIYGEDDVGGFTVLGKLVFSLRK
jgi:hypothetical protein